MAQDWPVQVWVGLGVDRSEGEEERAKNHDTPKRLVRASGGELQVRSLSSASTDIGAGWSPEQCPVAALLRCASDRPTVHGPRPGYPRTKALSC